MTSARSCIGLCMTAALCGTAFFCAGEELNQMPLGPGGATALLSAFEGQSDFKIRIHAPEEDTEDVLESLELCACSDIVQAAFEPIHAMVRSVFC
ncbi:hypothetical protein BESB_012150 [Besnoitia besnoiti]|uniref:Uncharacterized protein n=1 Tax=Besnoitia besnoiti TaxID=94643 RepID=A0A2A9MA87_BESBE|nr:hypothetical protein BESB_012150 [Besnoitia besnoiti]PFH32603.1 hypothetical protein BESB_012150 [Besnoitia besnoiti]